MSIKNFSLFGLMIATFLFTWTSCDDDDNVLPERDAGELQIEITDAPVDDPQIKAVYVTIVDLKINGSSFPDFEKKKINLAALQDGKTEILGLTGIEIGSYDEITLVLEGNPTEPLTYVEDDDGAVHGLLEEQVSLTRNYDFEIRKDSAVHLVIDFDLRKALRRTQDSLDQYEFVEPAQLKNALRVVNKEEAGQLSGKVDVSTNSDLVVAYLYHKGEFDENMETEVMGDDLQFAHAVTSARVHSDGNYLFPFLNPGEYELHFASYTEDSDSGQVELDGLMEVNVSGGFDIMDIDIESQSETILNLSLISIQDL